MIRPIKRNAPKPSHVHSGDFKQVLQFKITLRYTTSPVWRRILVPDSYTFWDLHVAISDVMPWQDCHLHVFKFSRGKRDDKFQVGIPDEILTNRDTTKAIPPLYGALVKNEQDVQLLERLAFMNRRQQSSGGAGGAR